MDVDVRDLLILSAIPGIGPNRLRELVSHFKGTGPIFDASPKQLAEVEGIEKKLALTISGFFHNERYALHKKMADQQLAKVNKVNGRVITFWDKEYPSNLKKIYDPPPFLFLRGQLVEEDNYSVAIVGTRGPSSYGIQMTERFSLDLAGIGISVISGLARGIDTVAHTATLNAGGRTIAVIGSGIDVVYPPENRNLFGRIAESGAIVSEFLMGTKPDAGNFPRRNRIISGIALGTVVVETGIEGGAMITISTALDQNRATFAIPSAVIEKKRSGTNLLIKEGKAALVESVDDIIAELRPQLKKLLPSHDQPQKRPAPELTLFEQQVYDVLSEEPLHIDVIAERAGLSTADTLVHLLAMEFKSAARQMRGKLFVKV